MNRLLTILLLAAGTAYGQIANPPTSANITFADGIALEPAQDSDGSMTYDGVSGLKFIKPPFMAPTTNFFALFPHWDPFSVNPLGWIMGTATNSTDDLTTLFYFASDGAFWAELGASFGGEISFRTNTAAAATRDNLGLGETSSPVFSNVTVNGTLSVGSLTTTTPSTWALDTTQTAADTNGILALPSNANVIRLTNNNAISGVSGGVLGAFYYLVNQTTNAVTISNVGGITIDGAQNLTLSPNESATLVATGATNASVAARGDLNDVTLGGTLNIAPAQTADSADSLMTRDLGDGRYSGFTGLQILPMEFSRASQNVTNSGSISIARGNVRITSGATNGSGGGLTFSDGRMFYTTQGTSTAHQGYGIYALNPQLLANTDTVFGIFYGSAPANGVPSFEPLSTNGYSVQLRNNGTNQLRYVYKNGTNEVSGPWTSLPVVGSSSVQFAGINTTNGFRVLYRRPTGLGTADWTVLTNVAVSWTWQGNPQSAGAQFSAISFIRTNTTSTNSLINDAGEFGFIIGGENL